MPHIECHDMGSTAGQEYLSEAARARSDIEAMPVSDGEAARSEGIEGSDELVCRPSHPLVDVTDERHFVTVGDELGGFVSRMAINENSVGADDVVCLAPGAR